MALQPSDRPAGSAHVLRFRGNVIEATATPLATFPKLNAEFPSGVADATPVGVRFLLADSTDLDDTEKRFPSTVFDDAQPTGSAPHDAVLATAVANVVSATESSIALRTWAQNLKIRINVKATNITQIDLGAAQVVLDSPTSGLGGTSGLPVVIIPMTFTDNQTASLLDIEFEIPDTASR